MHKLVKSAGLIGSAALLAGCGALIGHFIGSQTVSGSQLGLSGQAISGSFSSNVTTAAVSPQSTQVVDGSVSTQVSVPQLTLPQITQGISPSQLTLDANFTTVNLSGTATCLPDSSPVPVTVTSLSLNLSGSNQSVTLNAQPNVTFTLTPSPSTAGSYTVTAASGNAADLAASFSGSTVSQAFTILTSGSSTLQVSASLQSSNTSVAGCDISLTFAGTTSATLGGFN
jgi:hypothetical protein